MLHIYIVSLKVDLERRRVISKTLKDLGLKFSFIDAIYGKELSVDILGSFRNKGRGELIARGFPATAGEIGCTLSHLMAYQDILDNNINWACILEDDAILDERFKTFVNTFQDSELDPKILYLLGGQINFNKKLIVKSIRNNVIIGGQKFSKTIKSDPFIHGSCCYLVSSYLAESIINLSEKSFIVADDWCYLVKINVVNKIYLSDFVNHPSDLSGSHIQEERELGSIEVSDNTSKKNIFYIRVKESIKGRIWLIKWRLRAIILKFYSYIEKKENI